jgi:multidrug transporter EmrE-like cation transporter
MTVILGKQASLTVGAMSVYNIARNPYYLLALFCLGAQAVCWQFALKEYDLFWAYLFMSGIYIVIPAASYFIFRESISLHNIIGSLVIMAGIIILFTNTRETGRV